MPLVLWPNEPNDDSSDVWSTARRNLLPHIAEQERQAATAKAEEERLATIAAASPQYIPAINQAVQYFIDTMWAHKADYLHKTMQAERKGSGPVTHENCAAVLKLVGDYDVDIQNDRQYAYAKGGRSTINEKPGTWVSWSMRQSYHPVFVVRSNGRWYFCVSRDFRDAWGDNSGLFLEYGYSDNGFVTSAFSLVRDGTVAAKAVTHIAALLLHYEIPLPGNG